MAPLRKNKTPNKAKCYAEKSPSTDDVHTFNESLNRKDKPSHLLGPQWAKDEIERFYKGFRKSGKDWLKVAAFVETRSTAMVEALFSMNRAYLSLPNHHISVVGLIALMTDYYANLGESDGEHKTNEVQEAAKRPSKRLRGSEISVGTGVPSLSRTFNDYPENNGRLLTNGRFFWSNPCCVRKRTPRVIVSSMGLKNEENRSVRRGLNMNGAPEIAVAFPVGSQRDVSPKTSSFRIKKVTSPSPVHGKYDQNESQMTVSKLRSDYDDEAGPLNKTLNDKKRKFRKGGSKSVELEEIREAGYEIDDELILAVDKRELHSNGISAKSSTRTRRSNKVQLNDEKNASFEALEALADVSSRLPNTPADDHFTSEPAKPTDQESSPKNTSSLRIKKTCEVGCKITGTRKRKPKEVDISWKELVRSNGYDGENNVNQRTGELGNLPPTLPTPTPTREPFVSTKVRSRRKLTTWSSCPSVKSPDLENESLTGTKPLANCLSSYKLRRWCSNEWMYSPTDHPWFAKREFVEYLDHVGLGHIPKLTKVEWGVIRSSLGKPRRFSEQFLKEEKEKLNEYRLSVRNHHSNLRSRNPRKLSVDFLRPLSVGQRVIALHPQTREPHNGHVLTVDDTQCRIQFDDPQLGVALVSDDNCMLSNPTEINPASDAGTSFSTVKSVASGKARSVKEADVHALVELDRALGKKEAVVALLGLMNEEMVSNRQVSEQMKKQYAAVIITLNEVNRQVSTALAGLRVRNTYRSRSVDSAAHVVETVEASRAMARSMVGGTVEGGLGVDQRLIANCVAALLMIQTCTERQFPPSDVAEVLDSAVSCLKPACSLNIPIFADIEKCMGILKNQIFALIPS